MSTCPVRRGKKKGVMFKNHLYFYGCQNAAEARGLNWALGVPRRRQLILGAYSTKCLLGSCRVPGTGNTARNKAPDFFTRGTHGLDKEGRGHAGSRGRGGHVGVQRGPGQEEQRRCRPASRKSPAQVTGVDPRAKGLQGAFRSCRSRPAGGGVSKGGAIGDQGMKVMLAAVTGRRSRCSQRNVGKTRRQLGAVTGLDLQEAGFGSRVYFQGEPTGSGDIRSVSYREGTALGVHPEQRLAVTSRHLGLASKEGASLLKDDLGSGYVPKEKKTRKKSFLGSGC